MRKHFYVITVQIILLLATASVHGAEYRIIDLGTLGGSSSTAYGINSNGDIVGSSKTADGSTHAFIWQNGIMTDLGTLAGITGNALGINNNGEIVGTSKSSDGTTHAVVWKNGSINDLGSGVAISINDSGQIVGWSFSKATLWQNDEAVNLLPVGYSEQARCINNSGIIVGASGGCGGFIWENGNITYLAEYDAYNEQLVGIVGALSINDNNQIAGTYYGYGSSNSHAGLWDDGITTDLGTILKNSISGAYDINNSGQVAGWSVVTNNIKHACLWSDGAIIDLGAITGNSEARSINDDGLVVGWSVTSDGNCHACLWQPVPEPASILTLLCGISGVGLLIRYKNI